LFVYCANLAKKLQLPNLFVLKSNNLDEITSCIRIKCLSLQKIAASQHNIQASLIFCIRFATSLQKIAASQQYESKHSFAPAETYDENLLKTIQNK